MLKKVFSLDAQVWATSIANAIATWDQVRVSFAADSPKGISVLMFIVFLWIQIVYAMVGLRDGRKGMFWGMALSAVASVLVLSRIAYLYVQ